MFRANHETLARFRAAQRTVLRCFSAHLSTEFLPPVCLLEEPLSWFYGRQLHLAELRRACAASATSGLLFMVADELSSVVQLTARRRAYNAMTATHARCPRTDWIPQAGQSSRAAHTSPPAGPPGIRRPCWAGSSRRSTSERSRIFHPCPVSCPHSAAAARVLAVFLVAPVPLAVRWSRVAVAVNVGSLPGPSAV